MEKSLKIAMNRRVVDQLSPHHDSQFSAFSTEVFNQVNRNHNRSSSPFTTLADKTERKVVSTGAGDPTVDHRHDSELMHIMPNS